MLNYDDPFDFKLIAKKYGNWMIDLASKGKTPEQIRAMVMLREQKRFTKHKYEIGDCVFVISSKCNCYIGIIEAINVDHDEYSIRFEFDDELRTYNGIYRTPVKFIMGKIDPYHGKRGEEVSTEEAGGNMG